MTTKCARLDPGLDSVLEGEMLSTGQSDTTEVETLKYQIRVGILNRITIVRTGRDNPYY